MGLAAITEKVAHQRSIRAMEGHLQEVKRHATGNGRATKPEMVRAALARGWNPHDDNEADALWLLDFAKACLAVRDK